MNNLIEYPLILQKKESNSRILLDSILKDNNIIIEPSLEVVSQELVTELVNAGLGIGFNIIDLAKRNFPNLKELNINKHIPSLNVYLATNKSISLTFASKTFINLLTK